MNRRILCKGKTILGLILALTIILSSICAYFVYDKKSKASQDEKKMEQIKSALNQKRSDTLTKLSSISINNVDDNKEKKFIVELKEKAAIDLLEGNTIEEKIKFEKQVINNQSSVIARVESITGTRPTFQLGYLVNAFVIKAKATDLYRICQLPEVKKVYSSREYTLEDFDSGVNYSVNDYKLVSDGIDTATGFKALRENSETNYTGKSTLVAIIDTGVNYVHQDMKLDEGVETKYSKAEWELRIKSLGYGKYFSDKVPFGYNYIDKNNDVKGDEEKHGNHVAGIAGENGDLKGTSPNTQIIGLKVVGDNSGNTEQIVKAMEDAAKLGVDVVNMSLGSNSDIAVIDNFKTKVVKKLSDQGIICCVSAGNSATIDNSGKASNKFNMVDTSTISSPGNIDETITVAAAKISYENGQIKKQMSQFSAWGPTKDLVLKPEITAPGENILALYDESKGYETLSGTSMATPFISGCANILIEDIKKDNIKSMIDGEELKDNELSMFIKNNLLNTSEIIHDVDNYNLSDRVPYSVRLQGAGLVNINSAVNNKVIATYNDQAKLELGEVKGSKSVDILLTNYGDTDAKYRIDTSDVYEPINKNNGDSYCMVKSGIASMSAEEEVTVPARGIAKVKLTISASSIENNFIEGYIRFVGEGVPTLSMPMLGFAGSWYVEPVVDKSVYDQGLSYLEQKQVRNPKTNELLKSKTCLVANNADIQDTMLGVIDGDGKGNNVYDGNLNAFSPNGDGIMDEVYPAITQLRNIHEMKINIIDEKKKNLRVLGRATNVKRKDYESLASNLLSTVELKKDLSRIDMSMWDGKLYDNVTGNYEQAADGLYYIQLEIQNCNNTRTTFIPMPVRIDTSKPEILNRNIEGNESSATYNFEIKDNLGLEEYAYIYNDGQVSEHKIINSKGEKGCKGSIQLENIQNSEVYIMFTDIAGNQVFDKINFADSQS